MTTTWSDDWSYVGEGGRHAVFARRTNESTDAGERRLLRLAKCDLAAAMDTVDDENGHENSRGVDIPSSSRGVPQQEVTQEMSSAENDPLSYVRHVVYPRLDPYVDLCVAVSLRWDEAKRLRESALAGGRIPQGRRRDWECLPDDDDKSKIPLGTNAVSVYLLTDYRFLRPQGPNDHTPTWSCEIKPKAGYRTGSPLVTPANREAKYHYTRFEIHERLCTRGYMTRGWEDTHDNKAVKGSSTSSSSRPQMSRYNPLDLYSGDCDRMETALEALWDCPRNNLRLWRDDTQLVVAEKGDESHTSSHTTLWKAVQEEPSLHSTSRSNRVTREGIRLPQRSLWIALLVQVLRHENLLSKLLLLQQLDVLDADGAIRVFERLVDLVGHKEAIACVDAVELDVDNRGPLVDSPFPCPKDCATLFELCQAIDQFAERRSPGKENKLTTAEMDEAHIVAIRLVQALSKNECRYLLQNWLLSLAMCDVSFFVSLSSIDAEDALVAQGVDLDAFSDQGAVVARGQDANLPGVVVWNPYSMASPENMDIWGAPMDSKRQVWIYRVKVVDFDQKPAIKLKSRAAKEEPIQFFQASPREEKDRREPPKLAT